MSDTKLHFKSLPQFLEANKIIDKSDKDYSHTCMGDRKLNISYGKFKIKKEHYDFFIEKYHKWVFEYNEQEHLTEKHNPEYSPVLIDLDFRYKKTNNIKRNYKINDIKFVIDEYLKILSKFIQIEDKNKICFVMEKTKPFYDKEKDIVKDGVHIIMPKIISNYEALYLTRLELLQNNKLVELFKNLNYTNSISDIIDEAVIQRNNWFMYGSSKPGKEVYKTTNIFTYNNGYNLNNELLKNYSNLDYIKLFSINNFNEKLICKVNNQVEIVKKLQQFKEKIEGKKK